MQDLRVNQFNQLRFNLLRSAFTLKTLSLARDATYFVFQGIDKEIRNKRNLLKRHRPDIRNLFSRDVTLQREIQAGLLQVLTCGSS